jgi:hypothetical protein
MVAIKKLKTDNKKMQFDLTVEVIRQLFMSYSRASEIDCRKE